MIVIPSIAYEVIWIASLSAESDDVPALCLFLSFRIDEKFFTPDVACQALTLCTVDPGQPECHLYPLVNKGLAWSASQILPTRAAREKQYHKVCY